MVTAEWALTIPLFIVVVMLCAAAIIYTNALAITTNAARESARAYSIGKGEAAALAVGHGVAGENAQVQLRIDGEFVYVTVEKAPVPALAFLGVTAKAEHMALIEPGLEP